MLEPTLPSTPPPASTRSAAATATPSSVANLDRALDAVSRGLRVQARPPRRAKQRRNVVCLNETEVRRHWEKHPDDDAAILLDGYIAVEIDLREGGLKTFKELASAKEFPKTVRGEISGRWLYAVYKLPPGCCVEADRSRQLRLALLSCPRMFEAARPMASRRSHSAKGRDTRTFGSVFLCEDRILRIRNRLSFRLSREPRF
jgi:Bifunctional DNA primase/polymerase, N-terminal